jgi:hypothetical protein
MLSRAAGDLLEERIESSGVTSMNVPASTPVPRSRDELLPCLRQSRVQLVPASFGA